MNALQLIKEKLKSGQEVTYVPRMQKPKKLARKTRLGRRLVKALKEKAKSKPHVFGSRTNGSWTKLDNEEPKKKRKMREASQRMQR